MLRIKNAAWLLLLLALPSPSFAASGITVMESGSGSVLQTDDDDDTIEERRKRAEGLRKAEQQFRTVDARFRTQWSAFFKKRAAHRKDCREKIRRANRDTVFGVLLDCYKTDLRMENNLLAERRTHLEALPGLTKAIRVHLLDRLDLLIDAIDTTIFGIDSGVYDTQETLQKVRTNLRQKYRDPFADAFRKARADRHRSWIADLILQLDATIVEEHTESGSIPEALTKIRTCLTAEETNLNAVLTGISKDLSTPLANIQTCVTSLKTVPKWNVTGSGAMVQ